jgi:hypothetical protein
MKEIATLVGLRAHRRSLFAYSQSTRMGKYMGALLLAVLVGCGGGSAGGGESDTPATQASGPPSAAPPVFTPTSLTAPPRLIAGSGVAFAPFQDPPHPSAGQVPWGDAVGEGFDAGGQPARFSAEAGGVTYTYSREPGSQLVDSGSDGIIAWGRWIGRVRQSPQQLVYDFAADSGVHYVLGTRSTSIPTGGRATYTLIAATAPTWYDGSGAPGRLSGSLSVDFSDPNGRVAVNFVVEMDGGRTYTMTGSAYAGGANFRGPRADFPDPITLTGTNGACSFGCFPYLEGFFAGSSAERVGLAYQITVPQTNPQPDVASATIQGTAVFERR